MKCFLLCAVVLINLAAAGCVGDKSKELFETARFEEKQNNREHAEKLYAEIVAKYPDSPVAKQVQERLAELRNKR